MTKPIISGEEYKQTKSVQAATTTQRAPWQWIAIASFVVNIGLIIALLIAMQTPRSASTDSQKQRDITAPSGNVQTPRTNEPTCVGNACSSRNDGGGGIQPVVGVVVKATATAITIDVDGRQHTFTITSSTQEIDQGNNSAQAYNQAHSPTGEMVGVIPTVEGGTEAQLVISSYSKR